MRNNNAAILYVADEFHTAKNRIMGRHSANEGFLSAYAKYADVDLAYSYVLNENQHKVFGEQYQLKGGRASKIVGIPFSHPQELANAGCLYIADPNLAEHAFTRRSIPQKDADCLYSLCGITHTVSSEGAMQLIRNLLLSPVKKWDALVCTSSAVKNAVENIIAANVEYFAERFDQKNIKLECQLPIIPLGVHTQQFDTGEAREVLRQAWRSKLHVGREDIVFLFFGRLSFHAKANPFPMYRALEIAAQKTGKKLHLLQVGQFANADIEKSFRESEKILCPSVQCHYLDGGNTAVRQEIWYAADVFTSLVDNIQESFGLTPVEAMAAGLPVVVTDWNGYRDTIENGKQGFLIPTTMPSAGSIGGELADRFYRRIDNYDHYIANVASTVAVDIPATAKAYTDLVENTALRVQMGKAGRLRAESVYDWRKIMGSYQELWSELAEIRQRESTYRISRPANSILLKNPMANDPYSIFSSYPTHAFDENTSVLMMADGYEVEKINTYIKLSILNSSFKEPMGTYQNILDVLFANSPCRVQDLLASANAGQKPAVLRAITRLIKMGAINVVK